jgi:valine--tRNA ligase
LLSLIRQREKIMTQKFEMADRFNPSAVEQALYQYWEESGYFKPFGNAPSYCIKQHHV